MNELTIYRLYFTESDCYKKGTRITPCGVQVHSTGANNPWLRRYVGPDDGRLGVNSNGNTHNRPGRDVCASAYIGKLADGTVAVYQTLPWNYKCWLSGSGSNGNANNLGYIGFEICEDNLDNEQYFDDAMEKAVLLTAYLCQKIGVDPWTIVKETPDGPAYAVMDHAALHSVGLASNHADIGTWLKIMGYDFHDFRDWVRDAMDEGVNVTYIDTEEEPMKHPTLRQGDTGSDVAYLQTLLSDVGTPIKVDGIFGPATYAAVRVFQAAYGLKVDGVVGPKTWEALEKAAGHEENDPDVWDPDAPEIVTPPAVDIPSTGQPDTVTIAKDDWNAIKAAVSVLHQAVKKYESVG